jgi:hypothetical protein
MMPMLRVFASDTGRGIRVSSFSRRTTARSRRTERGRRLRDESIQLLFFPLLGPEPQNQ